MKDWLQRGMLGNEALAERRPQLTFAAVAAVGVVVLAPLLTRPTYALLLPVVLVAVWLAWISPAIPLALGGIPPLVDAIAGSNPLPKGGFTLLFSAWIALGVAFVIMRDRGRIGERALLSVPVLASCFLLGLMVLRLSASPDQAYGSMKVELYIADVLIFFFAAIFVGSRRADLNLFLIVLLGVTALSAVLFLFQLVTGAAQQVLNGRFSITAQEYPIDLARASADGLLIAIYFLLSADRRSLRVPVALITPAVAITMIAAGSRGPVVAFAVGLIALLALSATSPRARRRFAVVGAMFALLAIVVPLVVPSSAIGRALSTIVGSASGLSSNGRSGLWSSAIAAFSQHFGLGLGTGGFAAQPAAISDGVQYPHNLFLEVASELGIVGLAALVAALGAIVARLGTLWRSTAGEDRLLATILIALFLTAVTNACISEAIYGNGEVWLWGGLAIGMGARTVQRRGLPERRRASARAG
jgi:O-antigen ligase